MPARKIGPAFWMTLQALLFLFLQRLSRQSFTGYDAVSSQDVQGVSWLYGPGVWGSWVVHVVGRAMDRGRNKFSRAWIVVYPVFAVLDSVDCLTSSGALGSKAGELRAASAVLNTVITWMVFSTWCSNHATSWPRRVLGLGVIYLCHTASWNNASIHAARPDLWSAPLYGLMAAQLCYLPWLLDPRQLESIKTPWVWHGLAVVVYGVLPTLLLSYNVTGWPVTGENVVSLYDAVEWTHMVPRTDKRIIDPVQSIALLVSLLNLFVYSVDQPEGWVQWEFLGERLFSYPKQSENTDRRPDSTPPSGAKQLEARH